MNSATSGSCGGLTNFLPSLSLAIWLLAPGVALPDGLDDAPELELRPARVISCAEPASWKCFSADGNRFAYGDNRRAHIVDTHGWRELSCILFGEELAFDLQLSPDGSKLAYSRLVTLYVCDAKSGRILGKSEAPPKGLKRFAKFCPDGKHMVYFVPGQGILKWDFESAKPPSQIVGPERYGARSEFCRALACSPDGKLLAVAAENGTVHLVDAELGTEVRNLMPKIALSAHGLAFSPDGRYVALGFRNHNDLAVWEVSTGKLACELRWCLLDPLRDQPHPDHGNRNFVFTFDGRSILVSCQDGYVREFEIGSGGLRYTMRQGNSVCSSNKAPLWALFRSDREVVVFDARRGAVPEPPSKSLDPESCWSDLGSPDAAQAFRRMREMAAVPDQAIALLTKRMSANPKISATLAAELIRDLDAGEFDTRREAKRRLAALGPAARPYLVAALEKDPSAEQRKSVEELLKLLDGPVPTDILRVMRAVEVLEMIGSGASRRLLERLATGEPAAPQTIEARAALGRLGASERDRKK